MALKCPIPPSSSRIELYSMESLPHKSKAFNNQQTLKRLESLEQISQCGMSVSRDDLYHLLEACSNSQDLHVAQRIHALVSKNGFFSVTVLSDLLIRLFTACGSFQEAIDVFQKVPHPTSYTCNAAMAAHVKMDNVHEVFRLHHRMKMEGIQEDKVTILSLLKACSKLGDLQAARQVHIYVLIGRHEQSTLIGNSLVDMYAKCGRLDDARCVFDRLSNRTDGSWGALLTGYSASGYALPTLELFEAMKKDGIRPTRVAYLCALKASSTIKGLNIGRLLHFEIILDRLERDTMVESNLVNMYAKCDSLEDASRVFKDVSTPDVVTWGAIIVGYAQHGQGQLALELFEQMQKAAVRLNPVILSAALKACAGIGTIRQGQVLHDLIIRHGFVKDTVLASSIVDMYAKCNSLVDARKVFDNIARRDLVTWGTMMAGYAQHGRGHAALDLFMRMQQESIRPGKSTFLSALKACSTLGAIGQGRLLHKEVIHHELDHDTAILNTLIDMYAKCGSLDEAQSIFYETSATDIVSWGAMITGFVTQGYGACALDLFARLLLERLPANEVIYSGALRACGILSSVELAMLTHACVTQSEFFADVVVEGTLVDMYVKCGRLDDARSVFNCLHSRDIVSWGTLMMGFAGAGDGLSVMELFKGMLKEGLMPDKVTLLCGVKACGMLGASESGNWVHAASVEVNLETDVVIATNLVEMYANCDSIDDGCRVFKGMSDRDTALWGALIAGYASTGHFAQVHACLIDMQKQGLMPGDVIFTSILAACSRAGLVEEGFIYFRMMVEDFRISPTEEHCSCMVDLFARTGRLNDASDLTETLDFCDMLVWRSLLSSCRTYKRYNLATSCFEEVSQIDSLHQSHE
ncbi:hypothetical protein GOP47_0028840 [Adiantum capillus-veneris]|nr:hypothetical protein GOP47_0028840 [Adiantum capillus-veneris]